LIAVCRLAAVNRSETMTAPSSPPLGGRPRICHGHRNQRGSAACARGEQPMSVFFHAESIAAGKPKTKCANCLHHEATIADLQAWIEDLRQSRDRWRDLALQVEGAAADVASAEIKHFVSAASSRAA
jgi:hypothetical protein